jgi:OmpA-OmpF porin, OOP family
VIRAAIQSKRSFVMKRSIVPSLLLLTALLTGGTAAQAQSGPVEKVSVKAVAPFGFGSAAVSQEARDAMLAEVSKMEGVSWQTVKATGHTDSIGPAAVNERLSEKRAAAVKAALVGKGLDPAMIATEAKAAREPVADNRSADGRARNRRAEIVFEGVRVGAK